MVADIQPSCHSACSLCPSAKGQDKTECRTRGVSWLESTPRQILLVPWRTYFRSSQLYFCVCVVNSLEGDQGSTSAVIPQVPPSDDVYVCVPEFMSL